MKIIRTLAAVTVVASFLLASCGGSDKKEGTGDNPTTTAVGKPTTTTAEGGGGAGGSAVKIADFKFGPTPLEVKSGAAVKFTNSDDATHTATSTGEVPKDFDTGDLAKGDSKEITFDKAGKYTYYCDIHNYMKGEIDVK